MSDKKPSNVPTSVHKIATTTPNGTVAEYAVLPRNGKGVQLRRLTPKPLSKKQRRRIAKQFRAIEQK